MATALYMNPGILQIILFKNDGGQIHKSESHCNLELNPSRWSPCTSLRKASSRNLKDGTKHIIFYIVSRILLQIDIINSSISSAENSAFTLLPPSHAWILLHHQRCYHVNGPPPPTFTNNPAFCVAANQRMSFRCKVLRQTWSGASSELLGGYGGS